MILNNKGLKPIDTLNDDIKRLNLYHNPNDEDGRAFAFELFGKIKFCLDFGLITLEEWEALCEQMVLFLHGD